MIPFPVAVPPPISAHELPKRARKPPKPKMPKSSMNFLKLAALWDRLTEKAQADQRNKSLLIFLEMRALPRLRRANIQ